MKHNFFKTATSFLVVMAILVSITSCKKDFFDKKLYGIQDQAQTIKDEPSALALVNGCYALADGSDWWSGRFDRMMLECSTDDGWGGNDYQDRPTELGSMGFTNVLNADNSYVRSLYEILYQGVRNCNNTIVVIPNAPINDALKTRIIGEAKFLRAYYYFELVKNYGETVLYTDLPTSDQLIPRSPVDEVYAQIVLDLKDAAAALPDLPEPAGILADLRVAHPDATFRSLRELGRPLSALLPAGFPMLSASLLGLPPLTADSFDPELPVVGLLIQNGASLPAWLLAVHVVSGPELVAKLCTGDHAPFRAVASARPGLKLVQQSVQSAKPAPALAVFDNYLLIAENAESLLSAGPFAARMLPKRPPARAAIALRFSHLALESKLVPALRGLWAGYRTRLAHLDQTDRSAHGGRAPDFADPAQVILGADALVESVLGLVDGAAALELDLEPFANRLDATVLLEPEQGSEVRTKLEALAEADARALLTLPAETQFALGLSRTNDEREAAGKAAGDDWVRLLGARINERDSQQLRGVLADWELGRATQTSYGFFGGSDPGAFLVANVADVARLKRAGSGFFGLLALPGVRAPLAEFLGQPRVSDFAAPSDGLPNVTRKRLTFAAPASGKPGTPPLSFAWLVDDQRAFAGAGKNADAILKTVVQSARGEHDTLSTKAGIADSVQRIGSQAALFAYLDARAPFGASGQRAASPAPLFLSFGKREPGAALRIEITKPALDLALQGALGR